MTILISGKERQGEGMKKIIVLLTAFLIVATFANINTPRTAAENIETPQYLGVTYTGEEMCYFEALHEKSINNIGITDETVDYEKIKAAYIYIIEHTTYIPFDNNDITQTWRSFDTCDTPPTYYEELATGVLQYGIGSCENYAAALVFLLEGIGMEAKYVPGATYSVNGEMVRHAWAMVKFNGEWYHIDPQLEDDISNNFIAFKYFMKNDAEFSKTHLWGDLLPNPTDYDEELPDCSGHELIIIPKLTKSSKVFFTEEQAVEQALLYAENTQNINKIEIKEKTPAFPKEF